MASRPSSAKTAARSAPFYLQLRGDTHRFALTRLAYDSPAAFTTVATSSVVPQPGVWYLLTGEYDATAGTISLYVDGQLQQTVAAAGAPWPASGPFAVGRGFYNGNPTDWVSGTIDDVRTYSGTLPARQVAALAGTGSITVHTDQAGPTLNPTQFGAFLEEISHSGDGGIYAELVRNRDLKESSSSPAYWSAVQDGGASATIALDGSQPLNSANPVSLRLSVSSLPGGGRAGIANDGYWGVPVKSATSYHLSFFAKAGASFTGPLTASLESTGGKVWATATIPAVTTSWAKYTATLTTPKGIPATLTNRLIISTSDTAAAGASVWFGMVSLFPPTYDNTPNGLRVDLMQKLAALHPGFFRIPGGNYLEGATLDTFFNWKNTIGPIENRPGHFNSAWGYWSQDGMGLLEYLEMADEVGAQPILAVFAGYTLNGTVVPQGQLAPYVQAALDEIQYAIGPTSSTYGAMRAADGHPAPFDLPLCRDRQRGPVRPLGQLQRLPVPDVLRRDQGCLPAAEDHLHDERDEPHPRCHRRPLLHQRPGGHGRQCSQLRQHQRGRPQAHRRRVRGHPGVTHRHAGRRSGRSRLLDRPGT
jgi:hypothetical protein